MGLTVLLLFLIVLSIIFFRYLASVFDCVFVNKMRAAFVDVSPEELQKQKELQSSLQTVGVKSDSTESETKGDTEQVSFLQKLGNRLPVQFVVINTFRWFLKVPTNGAAFKPSEDSSTWTTESS